ncbi:50S ribosomal protein L35ae [Candidatus Woesearchaeota archaeon]|nr:50S ribosomal protein L35ae [Candidatus Woesearchaeota archaeon]
MEGTIVNFRGGKHRKSPNQMIVSVSGVDDMKKAAGLVGKKVSWTNTKGNSISGKISGAHGNSGAVKAIFEKGMPGQCLGNKVKIE